MSESDRAHRKDVSRWDLPAVEGAPLPRAGAKGVNVMHLTLVEREAWEHGYKDGHVEGVRKGEAELAKRIAEVDVKIAALEAIIGTLARPLEELDAQVENELTRLALTIAKHLVRRELKIDPTQVIGIIRHTVSLLPLGALESLALPGESYKLAFTTSLIRQVYGDRVNDTMLEQCRYVRGEDQQTWWIPSGRVFYSPGPADTPADELAFAQQRFFATYRTRDPFGATALTLSGPSIVSTSRA